jgi:hypothetical protein
MSSDTDPDISQSALEEALLSNIQHGRSKYLTSVSGLCTLWLMFVFYQVSTLSQLRSRYL